MLGEIESLSQAQLYDSTKEITLKLLKAFDTHSDLVLSAQEVKILATTCQHDTIPQSNLLKDAEDYKIIVQKLYAAQASGQGLHWTPRDVEAFEYTKIRNQICLASSFGPIHHGLQAWISIYRKTYLDGSHCLDYQWDNCKDYSTNVARDTKEEAEINANPSFKTPDSREELAKEWYLCAVSNIEKLKDAELWKVEVKFSSKEARVLSCLPFIKKGDSLPMISTAENVKEFDQSNPLLLILGRVIIATEEHNDVTLTDEEAALYLTAVKDIPFPKPHPSNTPSEETEDDPPEWVKKAIVTKKYGVNVALGNYPTATPEKTKFLWENSWREQEMFRLVRKHKGREDKARREKGKVSIKEIKATIEGNTGGSSKEHTKPVEEGKGESKDELKLSLGKRLAAKAKDREMAQKEIEMNHLRDSHHNREQGFKNEISKLESTLAATKEKLDKALREPDKVRGEYFDKIQRLHEKVSKLEEELKVELEAHYITKRDGKETVEKLEALKVKISRFKEEQKRFVIKTNEVINERNELRAARVTQAQLDDQKASEIAQAVDPLKVTIATLKTSIAKLQSEEMLKKSREAVTAIQELHLLQAKYRNLSEDLNQERFDRAQDAANWVNIKTELKGQIDLHRAATYMAEKRVNDLYRQLQEQQAVSYSQRETNEWTTRGDYNILLAQLAEVRSENLRLADENAQYRGPAASMLNVGKS